MSPEKPQHPISISGAARGESALALLEQMRANPYPGPSELAVVASRATVVDPFTGCVIRVGVAEHLAVHRGNVASYWEPRRDDVRSRLGDLLGELPKRFEPCGDHPPGGRDSLVLLPATLLAREHDLNLAAEWLLHPQIRVGENIHQARLLALALATLGDNARRYSDSVRPPIACAAVDSVTGDIELAVVNGGSPVAERGEAEQTLRGLIEGSRTQGGGLSLLSQVATRRSIASSLFLASGPGRVRIRDRATYATRTHFPGFAAGFTIHR